MKKNPAPASAAAAWNDDEPFPGSLPEAAQPARKRKKGTEAEIVLPESAEAFLPVPPPEEPGELLDGSEDDIAALEEEHEHAPLVSAVGDEESFPVEDDEDASATFRKEDGSMADKKAEKTKVEHIRDEIQALRAQGAEKLRPRDIIASLEKKGVQVTAPQVSVTLRDFDTAEKPAKAKKTLKPAKPAARVERSRVAAKTTLKAKATPRGIPLTASVEELEAVGMFVADMGDLARARAMLDAYAAYAAAVSRT